MSTTEERIRKAIESIRTCNNPVEIDVSSSDFTWPVRAVYVGSSGDLAIRAPNGNDVTYVGLAAGIWHAIAADRIYQSGTTATNLIGEYDEPLLNLE